MKRVNYNGMQMNPSATIVDEAAAEIKDARCKIFAYDSNGKLALATDGSKPLVGIATIEVGANDITGAESGKVNAGDDIDIQIKDIGFAIAGATIAKGDEITSDENGEAKKAAAGDYVIGFALNAVEKGGFVKIQISKYQKAKA